MKRNYMNNTLGHNQDPDSIKVGYSSQFADFNPRGACQYLGISFNITCLDPQGMKLIVIEINHICDQQEK